MKLMRAVQVYGAVCEAMEQETGFAFAHALCMAKARLAPHAVFFAEKDAALMQKYGVTDEAGNVIIKDGKYTLKKDQADAFFQEKAELDGVEVEVEKVRLTGAPERIAGKILELLLEVIDFQTEGEAET